MAAIDDAINSLSEDELDLLNSDPEMLAAFKAKYSGAAPAKPPSMLDKAAGGVARLIMRGGPGGVLGDEVEAGAAGVGDLAAGNGLDKAASSIKKVEDGATPDTTAANVGKTVGSMFTPVQIALTGGIGAMADAIAPWVGGLLKSWSEKAALNAIGLVKSIATKFGVDNLDGLAQFLLQPITFGGKTYEPIVTATSSTADMAAKAQTLMEDAGKMLETVAQKVDAGATPAPDPLVAGSNAGPAIFEKVDLPALKSQLIGLRGQFDRALPNLGQPVISKFQAAIDDIGNLIEKAMTDEAPTAFADLSQARTALGSLAFEHSSKMESTKALQDVYWKMTDVLKSAANKTSVGPDYAAANLIYHRAAAVAAALAGKTVKFAVKDLFAPGAGGFIGSIVGGVPGAMIGMAGGALSQAFGHQAIAQGLKVASPLVTEGIQLTARGVPFVGRAIADALLSNGQ